MFIASILVLASLSPVSLASGPHGFGASEGFPSDVLVLYDPSDEQLALRANALALLVREHYPNVLLLPIHDRWELNRALSSPALVAVYMFHGRPRGMVVGGEPITWRDVASTVSRSAIRHHVFECCFSARLYAYGLDEDRVSAVRGVIDAQWASTMPPARWPAS